MDNQPDPPTWFYNLFWGLALVFMSGVTIVILYWLGSKVSLI